MGWGGYGIYSGDGTQTCHYRFIEWAFNRNMDDEIMNDGWMGFKTTIPDHELKTFIGGISRILKNMPKIKYWNESDAIEWQMFAALLLDNRIKLPKILKKTATEATEYLLLDHSQDFNVPAKRRRVLLNFLKKMEFQDWVHRVVTPRKSKPKKAKKRKVSKLIRKLTLDNTSGNHYKRWIGELYENGTVITKWGSIDSFDIGSFRQKQFSGAGLDFLNEKEQEKLKKGYIPT